MPLYHSSHHRLARKKTRKLATIKRSVITFVSVLHNFYSLSLMITPSTLRLDTRSMSLHGGDGACVLRAVKTISIYVCVSNLQIVARRMLHVFNLPITRARVDGRHNEISVISEFENSISCMDMMEIGRCNDIIMTLGPCRSLNDAG